MIITTYEPSKELDAALAELLEDQKYDNLEHIKLAVEFVVRQEADDSSNEPLPPKGDAVCLKKVPPCFQALMKSEPALLITVNKHSWNEWSAEDKQANLGHFISRIQVDQKDNGDWKVSLKPWDVQLMLDNVKRFGVGYNYGATRFAEAINVKKMSLEMAAAHDKPKPAEKPAAAPVPASRAKAPAKKESPNRIPDDDDDDPPRVRSADEELGERTKVGSVKSRVSPLKNGSKSEEKEAVKPARKVPPEPVESDDEQPEVEA